MNAETTDKPAPDQSKLALERTFLAYERTLMAWNRTAISLITFGFALYKFYFFIHQNKPATLAEEVFGARTYGVCMMGIGILVLALASWQYRVQLKRLRAMYPEAPASLSLVLASLMGALGAVAFFVGLFRL
ncbi:MAG TPA: DUF202 domain-containing protein [Pirellulales bacterium]